MRLLAAVLTAFVVICVPASAAVVATNGTEAITITAPPGETNTVTVEPGTLAGTYDVTDTSTAPTAPTCAPVVGNTATCTVLNLDSVTATLDDGVDSLDSTALAATVTSVFDGGDGNDTFLGGAGPDSAVGGLGDDTLDGNGDADFLDYSGSLAAVTVNLTNGTGAGEGNDTIEEFEDVFGSGQADTLTGNGASNQLIGQGGNDLLTGLGGTDTLFGAGGFDTINYLPSPAGVNVNLATGVVSDDGHGSSDTVLFDSINAVVGSDFADTIVGTDNDDTLEGMAGDDTLSGRLGNDILAGQDNATGVDNSPDTVTYAASGAGVTANLSLVAAPQATGEGDDTIKGVQNLNGSPQPDNLTGDGQANRLSGGLGSDDLNGGGGNDTADYSDAVGSVTATLTSGGNGNAGVNGDGTDSFSGGIENLTGSTQDDILTGNVEANALEGAGGNDELEGRGGNDSLVGGAGTTDKASYANAAAGVTVNLGTGVASPDGDGSNDSLATIENVDGSDEADTLTGDNSANALLGAGDDDTLAGRGGIDLLDGEQGDGNTASYANAAAGVEASTSGTADDDGDGANDVLLDVQNITGSGFNDSLGGTSFANTLSGGGGNDTIHGDAGNDTLAGGPGTDTAEFPNPAFPVNANLTTGTSTGQGNDTLAGFENLDGSGGADVLTGAAGPNSITAGGGADTVNVRDGGPDTVDCGLQTDVANVDTTETSITACETVNLPPVVTPDPGTGGGGDTGGGGTTPTPTGPVLPGPGTTIKDVLAPQSKITKPLKKTTDTTPTFKFTSSEAGSTFECKVDKGSFAKCRSPFTTKKLKRGKHAFSLRAKDTAGNVDKTPAVNRFSVVKKKKKG